MRVDDNSYGFSLDIGGTAVNTTAAISLEHMLGYSIHAKWTKTGGVLAGSIKTQKSNDGTYWIDVTSVAIVDASGATQFEVTDAFYRYVRVVTTLTGGIATFSVLTFVKGV